MEKKYIQTENAPAAVGPYSQAIVAGDLVYTSGQIALDPKTGVMVGDDVTAQAEVAMQNLEAVLKAAGSSFDQVVKTTCFLVDMADFAAFNAVYEKYLSSKPARSCVAVAQLPKGGIVEVEAVAIVTKK